MISPHTALSQHSLLSRVIDVPDNAVPDPKTENAKTGLSKLEALGDKLSRYANHCAGVFYKLDEASAGGEEKIVTALVIDLGHIAETFTKGFSEIQTLIGSLPSEVPADMALNLTLLGGDITAFAESPTGIDAAARGKKHIELRTHLLEATLRLPEIEKGLKIFSVHLPRLNNSEEVLRAAVMDIRSCIGRVKMLSGNGGMKPNDIAVMTEAPKAHLSGGKSLDLEVFLDADLVLRASQESDADFSAKREAWDIRQRLSALAQKTEALDRYGQFMVQMAKDKRTLRKLLKAFQTKKWVSRKSEITQSKGKHQVTTDTRERKLSQSELSLIGIQALRILNNFKREIEAEQQSVHNQVSRGKRDYSESDLQLMARLTEMYRKCEQEITKLKLDPEVVLRDRMDQIQRDRAILQRRYSKHPRETNHIAAGYIETTSRHTVLYGNTGAEHSIIAALRGGQNVELLGPTGTGKTMLAKSAARIFSGREPLVVSGGPGVYRDTFFGSPTNLGQRDPGAAVTCMKEGRVLIIDEDNRIDPIQIAEIKHILGLKAGDTWVHPDTNEKIVIQPGFGIMVTRNERGAHHKDRHDLPPDYRREFTHGSFEIDYYTQAEMYYRFLLPKLVDSDGSSTLSEEEIGGDIHKGRTEYSPLLALVESAKEIQEAYKTNKLKNSVFESGYLIDLFNEWPEMQSRVKKDGSRVGFLEFLETKLLEFIKRPIGNPDRKKIIEILVSHGFFLSPKRDVKVLSTANEGEIFNATELSALYAGKNVVFRNPGSPLNARQVAALDPYHEINIPPPPPHPLQAEIEFFRICYQGLCRKHGVRSVPFDPHTFSDTLEGNGLLNSLLELSAKVASIDNVHKSRVDSFTTLFRTYAGAKRTVKDELTVISSFIRQFGIMSGELLAEILADPATRHILERISKDSPLRKK